MSWLAEIEEFKSYSEFKRFKKYLSKRLMENEIKETKVKEFYFGENKYDNLKERWFKDCSSNDIWRLVPPEFPFKGFFKKVIFPLDKAFMS